MEVRREEGGGKKEENVRVWFLGFVDEVVGVWTLWGGFG